MIQQQIIVFFQGKKFKITKGEADSSGQRCTSGWKLSARISSSPLYASFVSHRLYPENSLPLNV